MISFLTTTLGMQDVPAKYVVVEQKENWVNIFADFLLQAEVGESFMKLIVTGAETCVYRYDVKMKQQS